ncbi:cytochrome P450 [Mycena epipterygia]|nr:cytochrome P450 [Mycena epipterygia]
MLNNIIAHFGAADAGVLLVSVSACYMLFRRLSRPRTTALKGPSSNNVLFGMMPYLMKAPDATRNGRLNTAHRRLVLTDPKAITHYFTKETYGYVQTTQAKRFLERLIGRGLFWAEGDSHKRQRRQLNPAFSNASIKSLTPIFFDSAYKAKSAWDGIIESSPSEEAIIEVQQWMNHISLDTIGLAGFSHDFGALSGRTSAVATVFDSIGSKPSFADTALLLLSLLTPIFDNIPTGRRSMLDQLTKTMRGLANTFLSTTGTGDSTDKSVIGLLGKSENYILTAATDIPFPSIAKSASAERISQEEVVAQINVLLLAGYETTSISLTWALIELSRNPAMQTKLRNELLQADGDHTWEEITHNLPYLDAFTSEILRIHPPVPELQRVAAEDDILPLSAPIETASGATVDAVIVSKGTIVSLPIECINRSVAFWGPTAKEFDPSRWLATNADSHLRAQELQGYRHMLTFADGPRFCLGKGFALAEFKAVLSVLVRNFTFELPKGPETVIGRHRNILPRPKVEGEAGYEVPLRIRHYIAA